MSTQPRASSHDESRVQMAGCAAGGCIRQPLHMQRADACKIVSTAAALLLSAGRLDSLGFCPRKSWFSCYITCCSRLQVGGAHFGPGIFLGSCRCNSGCTCKGTHRQEGGSCRPNYVCYIDVTARNERLGARQRLSHPEGAALPWASQPPADPPAAVGCAGAQGRHWTGWPGCYGAHHGQAACRNLLNLQACSAGF